MFKRCCLFSDDDNQGFNDGAMNFSGFLDVSTDIRDH